MYNNDLKYAKVEETFKKRASYLTEKGYVEGIEVDELAYEIYLKEKDNGSNESE